MDIIDIRQLGDAMLITTRLQLLLLFLLALSATDSHAQRTAAALITTPIEESRLTTLAGNARREATAQNDRGGVPDNLHLDMYLQLKRSPERELAAKAFVESLTDRTSANFHHWITAAEYGERFGAAAEDIAAISRWLQSHGFTVNRVPAHKMVIDFSGDAGRVREAFHTEIHYLDVSGKRRFANMSDPRIPEALVPAVAGVVSLSDIQPEPMYVPQIQYTVSKSAFPVVPGDLAIIYNLAPAFAGGYTGQGQTIMVVEETDLYSTGDWQTFRKTFGLDRYTDASLTQLHPASGGTGSTCTDPGVNGADVEAAIDVEWATAAAPDAAIVVASCANTTNFGGFIALQNVLTNGGPLPSVVSISYGQSETDDGSAQNAFINTLYQTAAAAGVSVFVSSGDEGPAETDHRSEVAIHGVSVNGFASTPYNVAVGGTDFGDTANGATAAFWNPANGPYFDSAKTYIPEIPWNESCAGSILGVNRGYASQYGPTSFCNAAYTNFVSVGGSGGPSGCATGSPAISGVIGGNCAGYPKPSWQSIMGNPSDGVRDLPDVSLFAASGLWGHYYLFCITDGATCSNAPSTWPGAGGTSFAAPIMAGIQALINQAMGTNNVGNPNPVYYAIAQSQYSAAGGTAACNSSAAPAATCGFNDVTEGDIVVACAGIYDCYMGGGGLGVSSTANDTFAPAYAATPGWDFATGIGTVNVWGLLQAFVDSATPASPPPAPALVSPANAAANLPPAPLLTWSASKGATSYDVYFGTSSTPPLARNTIDLNYALGTLNPATTYYWAIGARNSMGTTVSAPWSFTTTCVAALNPSSATAPAGGGSGTISVNATSDCSWSAVSSAPWITIASGASGTGNGTVGYQVSADSGAQRAGTISIGGQTFTVMQGGISPVISTLVGGAMPATPAPGQSLSIPLSYGVAVDASGNIYFPSPTLNAVFKADANGVVTRIVGTGLAGYSGDNGPALAALLQNPNGVAVDPLGNVYIADTNNYRVRKVEVSGKITTAAGNGTCCTATGDGGPATGARIGFPYGLAADSAGNVYIADTLNSVVRKVSPSGIISTVAGTGSSGYSGDGGPATSARLSSPFNVAVDSSGNLYIDDRYNNRIRMVSSGTISTVAGNGSCCYSGDGGPAIDARMEQPGGVAVDSAGNLYIADTYNNRVRRVNTAGMISTFVGNGSAGFSGDGKAATAQVNLPTAVAVDSGGNLYIAESGGARIRQVNASAVISTVVGGAISDGGPAALATLSQPSGVVRDAAGNTYIADTNNDRVRKVAPDGTIATFAGTGVSGFSGDGGTAVNAQLNAPQGLALDGSGNLYIADSNNARIRKVDGTGTITTFAGGSDGTFSSPWGLAVDGSGNMYVADSGRAQVSKISPSGAIATVAGTGSAGYSGDGGPATSAKLNGPYAVALDATGNLYIADRYNYRIRMVFPDGTINTVAGSGSCCYNGDGIQATKASFCEPSGVAVDGTGALYIADYCNNRVRRVGADGTITTIAGNGTAGYAGDGGVATAANLQDPYGVAVDATGNIVITDQNNNVVRLMLPMYGLPVLNIQSTHASPFTPGQNGASYVLTVSNAALAGPTNGTVTVTELLPSPLTLVSMTGEGWTCAAAVCTRSDALSGGASYPPIVITVNVAASAPSQLMNAATASGGGASTAAAQDFTIVQR